MKKTTPIEGATLATLHTEIDRYCRRFGYDHSSAFEQLLNLMVNWLEIEDKSPHVMPRIGNEAAQALVTLMRIFFSALHTELAHRKWVDLFGDYFMEYGANKKDRKNAKQKEKASIQTAITKIYHDAGGMPIIFAQALMLFPLLFSRFDATRGIAAALSNDLTDVFK